MERAETGVIDQHNHDSDDDFKDEVAKETELAGVDDGENNKMDGVRTPVTVNETLCYITDLEPGSYQPETSVFTCGTCSRGFATRSGLKFHEKYFHTEGKLYCLVCKKPFKLSNDLERHMNTHTGNRPWKCSQCDKGFVCKSSLLQHEKLKHIIGDIYKCSGCSKTFNTDTDLIRHRRVHTGDKPFKCDGCTKSFTCKSSLNVHKRTHAGKNFTCTYCNMQFYIQSDLERHETVHTGKKPFNCEFCKHSYSCKSSYKVHLRNAHSELAPEKMVSKPEKKAKQKVTKRITFKLKSVETVHKTLDVAMGNQGVDELSDITENSGCMDQLQQDVIKVEGF